MAVAITGASGVVGSAVLRHLVESGQEVRAVARSSRAAAAVSRRGAAPVAGDVLDPISLRAAFAGCDTVFHVAGLNGMCLPEPWRLERVNVDGSRIALRAARAAGVRRFVHTSSAAALGEPAGTVGHEGSPHRGRYLSAYERSKHLSERVVLAEAGDLEVVVVNPSSVQGPGRASGTGRLILDVLAGRLPVLIDTRLSVVDIDDCARGHLLAAERGVPGERYVLNSFTLTTAEALRLAGEVVGRELRVRMLPVGVVAAAVSVVEGSARLLGRTPPVCREMVRTLAHGHAYDGSRATRELGLTYAAPGDTLRRMIGWFRSQGLLAA